MLHEPVNKNKYNENTEVIVLYRLLLYVIIQGFNMHIFVVIGRSNVRQADCVMPCDMLLRDKDEVNYFNYSVSILFTLKFHVIRYKLTPLFPDDAECTHLT